MDADALVLLTKNIERGIVIINLLLYAFIPIICVVYLLWKFIIYTRNKIQKDGLVKGTYSGVLALFEAGLVVLFLFIFNGISISIVKKWPYMDVEILRWVIACFVLFLISYIITPKNSGWRGTFSGIFVFTVLAMGWFHNQWLGVLCISLPILFLLWHIGNIYAQVILPANNPDDENEKRQRALVFLKYLLGIQFPVWVAETRTERAFEKRIDGDYTMGYGKPGVIYTWSHQAVGLSKGIEFNRVDGPGIIFTEPLENPITLVDLRTQLRTSLVETVTKDGIEVTAVIFAAFAINRENLPKRAYAELRHTTGRNFEIDHPQGSYVYSSGRVYSVLSMSGINTTQLNDGQRPEFYWDEWVMKQIEHITRQVVSERSLDELWHPKINQLGASGLEEMAVIIKDLLTHKLTEAGVNLFTVRIVNYEIPEDSHIVQQNIKTWSSYWEQKVTEAKSEIEMIYREEIENAHAYAKSILLGTVAEIIQESRDIHPDLPRHVIAQYYVHALEEYIKKQPGLNIEESKQRLEAIKDFLIYNRTEGVE